MANIKISELNPLLTVEDADVLPIVDNAVTKKVTAAILRSYTEGNSVLLTGAQTIAGIKTFTAQLASSVATGTAPFSVASTTKVTNLNADLLDGLSSADFQATLGGSGIVKSTAGTISYLTDNSTNWNTAYNDSIVSAAVTGTTTKLLTLNQQDGGTITASWSDYDTAPVTSVFGRTGAVVATEGDYSLTQLSDVSIGSPTNGQVLKYNGTAWVNGTDLNSGTVTSVGMSVPTGLSVSGSPITTSGTLALSMASGYSLPTDASQAQWNSAYNSRISSLTTTGSSGAATFTGNVLNIPNYGSALSGYVPYTGATTDLNLDTHDLYTAKVWLKDVPNGAFGSLELTDGVLHFEDVDGHSMVTMEDGYLTIANASTIRALLDVSALSANRDFAFPNASGTLALTSNLSSYLPLAGGTLTGNLNATTANFSGDVTLSGAAGTRSFTIQNNTSGNAVFNLICAGSDGGAITYNRANSELIFSNSGASSALKIANTGAVSLSSSLTLNGATPQVLLNRTSTSNSSATILQTNSTYDWFLGSNPLGALDSDYNFYSYGTSSIVLKLAKATGAATFSSSVTTGADATINGVTVGKGNSTIGSNTAVGKSSLSANITGGNNTTIGYEAAYSNTTGSNNTVIGYLALRANTTGTENNAIGLQALTSNIDGTNNTAIGQNSLVFNVSGNYNTAVGNSSLLYNTASNNTAVGFEAGFSNTSGSLTAIGYQALKGNTTGANNVANGTYCSSQNTTGTNNTALGYASLYSNVTGNSNAALGSGALFANTASNNTAVGFEAASSNTSGVEIVALGYRALKSHTTGTGSVAIGFQALTNNTASYNTAIGWSTLSNNTVGGDLVAIGANQQSNNYGGVSMIGILDTATGNNQMRFGSSAVVNGAVTTEVNASTKVWNVFINGVAQKILLA
jgi:hypothetical protein